MEKGADVKARNKGFTLIELMVVIVVGAILLMIAVPSFRDMILAQRLATAGDNLAIAINTARMEAIKRNGNVQFCSDNSSLNTNIDSLGVACDANVGAVYAADNAIPPNIGQVLNTVNGLGTSVKLTAANTNIAALRFDSQGIGHAMTDATVNAATGIASVSNTVPFNNVVAELCVDELSRNNIYTINMTNGSILDVTKSTGTCP
ncbi:MAG: GspH/FimT family pseudopilin [Betaproteobacteria bacterium]|nr:GspH/FimT family pseudopilin [Betaproteobacteria bacterium]